VISWLDWSWSVVTTCAVATSCCVRLQAMAYRTFSDPRNSVQSWKFCAVQCFCRFCTPFSPVQCEFWNVCKVTEFLFAFYPRDAMLLRSLRQRRVCPSVCSSVCLSHAGIVPLSSCILALQRSVRSWQTSSTCPSTCLEYLDSGSRLESVQCPRKPDQLSRVTTA